MTFWASFLPLQKRSLTHLIGNLNDNKGIILYNFHCYNITIAYLQSNFNTFLKNFFDKFINKKPPFQATSHPILSSFFHVTNISFFIRIKRQIANGCNQAINPKGYVSQKEVCQRSRFISIRFQRRMVDDNATNKTKEKG